ncbi:hypothetical protein [Priestia endophytica]|uniref:hypothetical protein n=1 Tax=Priestia endophytica TaxID=135735 RepID=UPI0022809EA3|nr:hypothetical protein [Priestia endophytica]MCY8233748.1 hypothetical protein [Priestia endophytica]
MSFESGKNNKERKYNYDEKNNNQNKKDKKKARVLEGPMRIDVDEVEDPLLEELQGLIGESILIVTESDQLNLFGQAFRPIFCGTVLAVEQGAVTLFPVNIKMVTAPFFQFPIPLSIPLEKIAHFTPNFDCNARIPLT